MKHEIRREVALCSRHERRCCLCSMNEHWLCVLASEDLRLLTAVMRLHIICWEYKLCCEMFPTGPVISLAASPYLHFSYSLINVILRVYLPLTHHCVILSLPCSPAQAAVCLSFTQHHFCHKEWCHAAAERSCVQMNRTEVLLMI